MRAGTSVARARPLDQSGGAFGVESTGYAYDDAGQQTAVTDPLGAVSTTTYDAVGRPITVTDADGRAVTSGYDAVGRLTSVIRGDGSVLAWSYDAAGQQTTYTDAAGATTGYTYDAAGRTATRTDTAGRVTKFAYDAAGNLISTTAADGTVTARSYDALSRVTGIDYAAGTPDVTYAYDAVGRRTNMVDGTGTTTYAYDAAGRPTQIAGPSGTVGYEWNDLGQLVELAYPDSSVVARTYDDAGELQTLTDWDGQDYALDWTEDGQLTAITYPSGVQTTTQYDEAGRAETITAADAVGAELLGLAYEYSDAGLQTSAATTRSGTTDLTAGYTWDGQARLDTIVGTLTGDVDFSPADHVTTLPDGTALAYDTTGQLLTATTGPGATTFDYDGRGNRVNEEGTSGIRTLVYDDANRLVSVNDDGDDTWTYSYDGDGLRSSAARTEASGVSVSDFAWDLTAEVPLLLSDGEHSYLYGLGTAPLAQRDSAGQQEYLHGDALGSIRTVTDSAGSVIAESNYQPYGLATATAEPVAAVTRFGFAGEYTDPTGLLYLRARYYDPTTAQFVTIDPLVDRTLTAYGYTGGNPLQYVDPLGLEWWEWLIDSNDESLVLNALQSFGSGALDAGIGALNLLNGLTAGGWDVYPYVGNPNDCGGIYDGSYYVGQATFGALAFVLGARATTGRSSSAGPSASDAGAATAVDGLPGLPATAPMPLGRGSTGRIAPRSLTEQLAMEEVRTAPGGTALTKLTLTDTRWPASEGWVKMQQTVNGVNIHYVRNVITGAVDDFKFKR